MAYGNFLHDEVTEDHPLNPVGIYGALKVAGEKMVIAYQQVFGLNYTIIRPSALYGPGCVSRRVGQVFIENAFTGLTLRVDGDGGERLDFTYIDDLIQGTLLMMRNPAARNEIFNLTYGASRPISDLVAIIRRYFPDVRVESVERDGQMPVRGTQNIKKAVSLLASRSISIGTGNSSRKIFQRLSQRSHESCDCGQQRERSSMSAFFVFRGPCFGRSCHPPRRGGIGKSDCKRRSRYESACIRLSRH
jgi:GDP-D-mannose dehydratase